MPSRSYKTLAIMVARSNYSEADRIYQLLTPKFGKLSAIGKGVRRPTSKLGPHLEPFAKIELVLAKGKNLEVITGARLQMSYGHILDNLETVKRGFLFNEMANKLTSHTSSAGLFTLLDEALAALNSGIYPQVVELGYKLKLLDLLGYRPNLGQSIKTHKPVISGQAYSFSHEGGGLAEKAQASVTSPTLSEDEIKLWRLLLQFPFTKVAGVKGVNKVASASLAVIDDFYAYTFDKRFKSSEI